eukprot:Gb_37539 [translate_table: standard]
MTGHARKSAVKCIEIIALLRFWQGMANWRLGKGVKMDGKAGPQVASPYFQHQFPPGRFYDTPITVKRFVEPADSSWTRANWQKQPQQVNSSAYEAPKQNWNVNHWDWDSVMFVAKPADAGNDPEPSRSGLNLQASSELLRLGSDDIGSNPVNASSPDQKRKLDETVKPFFAGKDSAEEDAGNLTLKLGGSSYSYGDETNSCRQNKRVRSGSPGNTYPMCQVDDCRTDLTSAKDYHRRHKVCEAHSKASKALVGNLMQRFCQQCSRFHPLQEFDEGKRSCRRRLAGHNRRRRKTQPEDALSRGLLAAGQDNGGLGNLDIVNLISILSRLQGNNSLDKSSGEPALDRDRVVQFLSKMQSFSSSEIFSGKIAGPQSFDLNVAHGTQTIDQRLDIPKANIHQSPPLTADVLAILSALTGSSPDALTVLLNNILASNLNANLKAQQPLPPAVQKSQDQVIHHLQSQRSNILFTSGTIKGKTSSSVPDRVSERSSPASLPLQLFNSCEENNPPHNFGFTRKYFSSDSSNPIEERSPSSSPPVVQKLFPLHSGAESKENDSISVCKEDNVMLETSPSNDRCSAFNLPKVGNRRAQQNFMSSSPCRGSESRSPAQQTGYTSSSGSDQSPASSNSDSQRTGRIIFKLFGKDPGNFPVTLRSQILEWLSHSPSDMESYIRPGCVILSIYTSMPYARWEQLRGDLQQRLKLLVEDCSTDFWRSDRVLVQAENQLASFKDGKIRLCRSWTSWSAPEIYSVQPLAVVAGQETTITLRGHNLAAPGTKILCAYGGKYTSQVVLQAGNANVVHSESMLIDHRAFYAFVVGPFSPLLHKMFCSYSPYPDRPLGGDDMQVEHGFKGDSFPIIVADSAICRELQSLECEMEDEFAEDKSCSITSGHSEGHLQDYSRVRIKEEVINFLNELGWLFQKFSRQQAEVNFVKDPVSLEFSSARIKFLLIYTVERDWCALLKKLLDIFYAMNAGQERSIQESSEMLSEANLLHRAVKRNCKKMVDFLLHYVPLGDGGASLRSSFTFTPNVTGPGGLTPLHLAASIQNCEDLVDSLTSDPQEIGLQSWNSALDSSGQTPHAYALMRNNHSYNRLVGRKLADRRSAQVSITILKRETDLEEAISQGNVGTVGSHVVSVLPLQRLPQTCAQCMSLSNRRVRRTSGNQGALYRPYVHSMLAIAAVCVCVCLLFKGPPQIGSVAPFQWENVAYGAI